MRLKDILHGAFHSGLSNLLKIPLTFLSVYLLISALNINGFGVLTIALSYSSLLIYVLNGGIDKSILIVFPTAERLAGNTLSSVWLGFLMGALILGLVLAAGWLIPDLFSIQPLLVILALIYGAVMAASRTIAASLRIRGEIKLSSYHDSVILPSALCLGALAMSHWHLAEPTEALMIHIGASLIVLLGLAVFSASKTTNYPSIPSNSPFKPRELIKFGMPLGIAAALNSGAASVCIAVSAYFVSAESIAEFSIALRLNFLTLLAVTALNPFVATAVARAWGRNETDQIHSASIALNRCLLLWSSLCLILICLFDDEWMALFGITSSSATYSLLLVSLGSSISSITSLNSQILSMSGHIRTTFNIGLLSVATAAIAALVLSPLIGSLAPASAYLISQMVIVLLRENEIKEVTGRRSLDFLWLLTLGGTALTVMLSQHAGISLPWRIGLAIACASLLLISLGPGTYSALKLSR